MGLRSLIKRQAAEAGIRRVERKVPVLRRWIDWLTDPAHSGRKRGIAVGAALLSGALRGVGQAIAPLCAAGTAAGTACNLDYAGWAGWVQTLDALAQNVLVPGADLVAVAMGGWGLIDAKKKADERKAYVSPRP